MTHSLTTYQLADQLGQLLQQRAQTVATAESCTGGGVAQAITAIPGSSNWFEFGAVTYSNPMKTEILGVPAETLATQGAVSCAVVEAMVAGLLRVSGADFGVAVSGIAGPGGAVAGKPVGTVCFAWGNACHCDSSTEHFAGDRAAVRQQAVDFALAKLISLANTV